MKYLYIFIPAICVLILFLSPHSHDLESDSMRMSFIILHSNYLRTNNVEIKDSKISLLGDPYFKKDNYSENVFFTEEIKKSGEIEMLISSNTMKEPLFIRRTPYIVGQKLKWTCQVSLGFQAFCGDELPNLTGINSSQ